MKKRIWILALILVLTMTLAPSAFAAQVVLSPQNLQVDGKTVNCEKYNIDGSNYFKLRDIAYLVNNTGSQFSVGWDSVLNTVSITTGESYAANGSELDTSAGDKSSTAVPSTQTIQINGTVCSSLSVYNIGGNNFFKLRDLGEALGFDVDYISESNTATVETKAAEETQDPVSETESGEQTKGRFSQSDAVSLNTYCQNAVGCASSVLNCIKKADFVQAKSKASACMGNLDKIIGILKNRVDFTFDDGDTAIGKAEAAKELLSDFANDPATVTDLADGILERCTQAYTNCTVLLNQSKELLKLF